MDLLKNHSPVTGKAIVMLLIVIQLMCIRAEITVLEPSDFDPAQGAAPYLYGYRGYDITGYIQIVPPCCQDCPAPMNDSTIALLNKTASGCSLQTVARALQATGFTLVIASSSSLTREPGDLYLSWDGSDYLSLVPVVQITGQLRENLKNASSGDNSTRVLVRVVDNDSNRWVEYWHSPGVLAGYIIVGLISFGLLGLSIWKLIQFFKAFGPQISIPIVSLGMEALSNIARILWCVDPIGASRVLDTLGRLIILTISLPFVIIVTILTAFYWYELISKRIKSGVWIGKTQLPFFIICAALLVMEIIFDVLRGLYIELGVTITLQGVIYVIYAAMLIASSLFFFVIGTKVLLYLHKTAKHKITANGSSKRLFIKTILMVVGNGVFNLILVVAFGVVIFLSNTPESQYGFYMFLMLTLCVISGSHIMAFNTPDLKKSSGKSKKSHSKGDTEDKSALTHNSSTVHVPMEATGQASPRAEAATSEDNNRDMAYMLRSAIETVPNELFQKEIFPHLSWMMLAKVARVSKRFSVLIKGTASYELDFLRHGWFDRQKIMTGLNRCKFLALQITDEEVLKHASKIRPLPLEHLNLINIRETDEIVSCTIQLFKNLKPNTLKVVRIFNIDFKLLISNNIVCPSVNLLEISAYYMKDRVTKTEDVLTVFPNLKRLEFMQSAKTDLYTYLATHVETPLEHVTFDITRNDSRSEGKFRAQIKSIDFAHFIPARLGHVLEDMTQLTHLTHRFVTPGLVAPRASNLVSLNINTNSEIAREIFAHAKNIQYLAINREVLGDVVLPNSLKSVTINADKDPFNPKSLLKLVNLEVLKIYGDATPFWKCDFSHMTRLREVHFEGDYITQWNNSMDRLENLTYVVISAELKYIPGSFFKGCRKIEYLNLDFNHLKKLSTKLGLLENLHTFSARANMMKKVPYGLARLNRLSRVDLRDNPISSVPITLPLRTVIFTDPEWIRTLQSTLMSANTAPTVHQMLRLPFIRPLHKMACLSESVNRRILHGLGVADIELEDHEKNIPLWAINEGTNSMIYAQSKLEAVALLLFVENFKRTANGKSHVEQRFVRATLDEKNSNKLYIYSLVVDQKKEESNLVGVLSEIDQFELKELRRKIC